MEKLEFRLLKNNEIDVRIGTQKLADSKDKSSAVIAASYLLYKDARVDMALLDEVVGCYNWQRTHCFKDGKLYCTVSIWDDDKKQWVSKEDVGVESNTEAEKGQASDSFKRACFNFGIGRELYTAPFIWIKANPGEDLRNVKMRVKHIGYDENRKITELIIEDRAGNVRYEYYDREKKSQGKITKSDVKKDVDVENQAAIDKHVERTALIEEIIKLEIDTEKLATYYRKNSIDELDNETLKKAIEKKKARLNKENVKC